MKYKPPVNFLERLLNRRSRQREAIERKYGVHFADHDHIRDDLFDGRSYTQQDIRLLERQILGRRRRSPRR